ncbi:hypothetical protein AVEN_73570-1 [Araneus ventricosus]|uniref:Uncharacterized protein n=1 Tax=Araneus ventricosus TaxID=182803 RepID=A0A4Y2NXI9_ARAVE|nr:hypothetical protein AVEN_210040-1 [Araneus ventricosus]GBN42990.1 hypothetical protein AVEN_73570-1 [Araneus ventricosus]
MFLEYLPPASLCWGLPPIIAAQIYQTLDIRHLGSAEVRRFTEPNLQKQSEILLRCWQELEWAVTNITDLPEYQQIQCFSSD